MASTHPAAHRAPVATTPRKRNAAESAKKTKVIYPTTVHPDAFDRVPTMSIADSALLQATLTQSRHTWTHTAFTRFFPEPAARGPGGKKYASELTSVGHCTVCIGPHMFLETKFFAVLNPAPPPPPLPVSSTSTAPNATSTIPTEDSPSTTPTVVMAGGSPAPDNGVVVMEPDVAITADTPSDTVKEVAESASVQDTSSAPTPMDVDTPTSNEKAPDALADKAPSESSATPIALHVPSPKQPPTNESLTEAAETPTTTPMEEDIQLVKPKAESTGKPATSSRPTTPTSSGAKVRVPPTRPQRPTHQVAFEFKENPGVRWLFPRDSSLELIRAENDDSQKISASFWLATTEEPRIGTSGTIAGSGTTGSGTTTSALVTGPGQATTIVILQATNELWAGLQQSIGDPASTYRYMMEKMKHIPPRAYVQYNLPIDFPDDQLQLMGFKKLPDNQVVPLTTLEPSKRKLEALSESQLAAMKAKRTKSGQEDSAASTSKSVAAPKKSAPPAPPAHVPPAPSHRKQCAYCGVTSTPTWRRGPDGPHTLCNACGVKWRQGKIFLDPKDKTASTPSPPAAPAPVPTPTPPPPPAPSPAPVVPPPSVARPSSESQAPASDPLTTTAEAAARMHQGLQKSGADEQVMHSRPETKAAAKRSSSSSKKQDASGASEGASTGDGIASKLGDTDKPAGKKKGGSKASAAASAAAAGPKLVPIHQIGETVKPSGKAASIAKSRKEKEKEKGKGKEKDTAKDMSMDVDKDSDKEKTATTAAALPSSSFPAKAHASVSLKDASVKEDLAPKSATASPSSSPALATAASASPTTSNSTATVTGATSAKPTGIKAAGTKKEPTSASASASSSALKASKQKASASSSASSSPTSKTNSPTTAAAKLSLLKSISSTPRYQTGHPAAAATVNLADDGLALYATKNLYTNTKNLYANNTATFPLHFPTISIAFGPNNAYYMYPNCAVVLFENHFQIKLIHGGERSEIDIRKEGIEGTEFQVVDVGDGESMIVMKTVLRQDLERFSKVLLSVEKNETSIVFRFRERLDGGGPPVKPLLEHWLTTEIPVAPKAT